MKAYCVPVLLVLVLLVGCYDETRPLSSGPPLVSGGTWTSMSVWFRYHVTESSDASLVGQVFEDPGEGTPTNYGSPWHFGNSFSLSWAVPDSDSALYEVQSQTCDECIGSSRGFPPDMQLLELTCDCFAGESCGELRLGAAELTEEGNPRRLVGDMYIFRGRFDDFEYHRIDVESIVIQGPSNSYMKSSYHAPIRLSPSGVP